MESGGNDRPMIYTTKGNMPLDMLTYSTRWQVTAEHVQFIETYTLHDEIVKENAHVLMLSGVAAEAQQQTFS